MSLSCIVERGVLEEPLYYENEPNRAEIVINYLSKGYATTLGNLFRRVLLSSLSGIAVSSVKIEGVLHEFQAVPGMKEDITDLLLNIKSIVFSLKSDDFTDKDVLDRALKIKAIGPCVVTAAMILDDEIVEVKNKDLVLCYLGDNHTLDMDLTLGYGMGSIHVERRSEESKSKSKLEKVFETGRIEVDAIYTPVRNVTFSVESSRKGQSADYEKLILEVETNGSLDPKQACELAATIARDQLQILAGSDANINNCSPTQSDDAVNSLHELFMKPVSELEFSVRAMNCLRHENIALIGDLVQKTEADMLKTPNFGRKSLNEIKCVLNPIGVYLGMNVENWKGSQEFSGDDFTENDKINDFE